MSYKSIMDQIKEWTQFLPISKREYFKHIILILDCTFILFRVSYESFLTIGINLSIYIFDILVYSYWAYDIYHKIRSSEDSLGYIKNRIYYILGLFPFPIFRLFLLISTLKQGIII